MTAKSMSRRRPLRLGLYGGTFDPVHLGHLIAARDALEQMHLDAVLFIPCARSPFKTGSPRTTDAQRVAMLRHALQGEPRFWFSRCELDRPAPSYTIDTAREVRMAFPHATFFWLIGADLMARLHEWAGWEDLRREVKFLLLERGKDVPVPGDGAARGSGLAASPASRYICHRDSPPRESPPSDRPPGAGVRGRLYQARGAFIFPSLLSCLKLPPRP